MMPLLCIYREIYKLHGIYLVFFIILFCINNNCKQGLGLDAHKNMSIHIHNKYQNIPLNMCLLKKKKIYYIYIY